MSPQEAADHLQKALEKLISYACEVEPTDYDNAVQVVVRIPDLPKPFTAKRPISVLQSHAEIQIQAENLRDEVTSAAAGS